MSYNNPENDWFTNSGQAFEADIDAVTRNDSEDEEDDEED